MIDWSKQHCGVHQASHAETTELMPDIIPILDTFPENPNDFTWDIKVHMLMPGQYPCIPNWHVDNVPRDENGKQDFSRIQPDKPMYLWLSGIGPKTEFKRRCSPDANASFKIPGEQWFRFTQRDAHRGSVATEFCWRAFIRATHKDIMKPKDGDKLRRHTQVYLDAENFKW